jgi:hypothetical protein
VSSGDKILHISGLAFTIRMNAKEKSSSVPIDIRSRTLLLPFSHIDDREEIE